MIRKSLRVGLLLPALLSLPRADAAITQAEIPEPEIALIRAFGFIEGPRLIARTCSHTNPSSAESWNREVTEFEERRSSEAAQTRKLFSETYARAIGEKEAMAILNAKVKSRLEREAEAKHLTLRTLCMAVSIFGGKKAFETKGFEETMESLAGFEKSGEYKRLKTRIVKASSAEKVRYKEKLLAYQIK